MTGTMRLTHQDVGDPIGYRVENRNGVKLVFGSIPVNDFVALANSLPKDAVDDPGVARICDANFAIGSLAALYRISNLGEDGIRWLAVGRHGASSLSLFTLLTGWPLLDEDESLSLPHDPSDFARCRQLLEAVPALAARMPSLIEKTDAVRSGWSTLAQQWAELCALQDSESPKWREGVGKASALFERLQSVGKAAEERRRPSGSREKNG